MTVCYNKLYGSKNLKKLYATWKQQKENTRVRLMYGFPKPLTHSKLALSLKTKSAPVHADEVDTIIPMQNPPVHLNFHKSNSQDKSTTPVTGNNNIPVKI